MSFGDKTTSLLNDFAEFLTTQPSTEQIITWHPSQAVQERISDLLLRNNAGLIEPHERQELDNCLQAEVMLCLLKAKLRASHSKSNPRRSET
jgi:hypothetical protein